MKLKQLMQAQVDYNKYYSRYLSKINSPRSKIQNLLTAGIE